MTTVVDIRCPDCGARDAVRKVGVGRYRCEDCGQTFEASDILDRLD